MIFQRIKSEGVAHNSYFIGSGHDAVVIDPRRDCDIYVELARRHGLFIKHILETHRNEDYVIGSTELAKLTGARIFHGEGLPWGYGETVADGQQFDIGALRLTALRTPGHTDESMSYVVTDRSSGDSPVMVFTGDALFVDDVGRIDLYGPAEAPRLASTLYDSIFNQILPLGDGVVLCSAHGGGSICGMNIGDRDESTLGIEKAQNPMLRVAGKDEFVRLKLSEQPERPPYFARMEQYNLNGAPLLGRLPSPPPLTAARFKSGIEAGAVVVDTRRPPSFGGAHIRGSYSIWLEGLPAFAGWFLPNDKPLLLVLEDKEFLERAVLYLLRLGYDRIEGYIENGIEGWYDAACPVERLGLLSVQDLKSMIDAGKKLAVLDVRGQGEWNAGHIAGAQHIYVGHLEKRLDDVPGGRPVAVYCNVGNRAGLAASILARAGRKDVYNVLGSMKAWRAAGYPVSVD